MKTLLTAFLIFLFGNLCFAQQLALDSAWAANGQNFRVELVMDENSDPPLNTSLKLFRNDEVIIDDMLWCSNLNVKLQDMDDDGFDDLLVYQGSGARANETYNLFLFRKETNDFQKVQGYEEWPNLEKTEIKGVLVATILTARVEYRFFEIDSMGRFRDLNNSVDEKSIFGKGKERGLRQVKKLKQ